MLRNWMKLTAASTLALALVVTGCENLGEQRLLGTSEPSRVLIEQEKQDGYVIAKQTDSEVGTVSALIGAAGGKISLGHHQLLVPANAVSAPTTFTMTKLHADDLRMELTATQLTTNDIGSQGFAVPVELTLSYKSAAELPSDESKIQILWLKLDGTIEPQSSSVDVVGKRVKAPLGHFSEYSIGWPNYEEDSTF